MCPPFSAFVLRRQSAKPGTPSGMGLPAFGRWTLLLAAIFWGAFSAPVRAETLLEAPEDFLSFASPGIDGELQNLRNLYWSVYWGISKSGGNFASPWYPWMVGIELAPAGGLSAEKRIQWANSLSNIKIAPDGYVSVGQHYSHAHDGGWPFPNWPQIFEPGLFRGYTAGWHFQDKTESFIQIMFMEPIIEPAGHAGDQAVEQWDISDLASDGRLNGLWHLRPTGKVPSITLKEGVTFRADCAPFVQIRFRSDFDPLPDSAKIVMQWKREGEGEFSEERQISMSPSQPDPWERPTKLNHCHFPAWKHPLWTENITGLRFLLPALEEGASYDIDSIFTAFDTRHPVTNTGFLLGASDFFRWTGDAEFLARNIGRMRSAMKFCRTELGGDENKFLRIPWAGHDGRSGYVVNPDGTWKRQYGVGIGNNYWDLLPFGGDDMYATTYFYASLLALAEIEDWIAAHGTGLPAAPEGASAKDLRKLAEQVKEAANRHFWNEEAGRFIACIDRDGNRRDFGYTFVNLEAVYYGLASDEHAKAILAWIAGERIVGGDTSTGADIYRFRFGPRASTLRNDFWYLWAWPGRDKPWGGQVQDGGAVLGFAYHDLMSRLRFRGAGDAAKRMDEMLAWLKETQEAGGFRPYYAADPSRGTMQGGGPDGGLGIDNEFVETELWPSFLLSGFIGFRPTASGFVLDPKLPDSWPSLTINNIAFRGSVLSITVTQDAATITVNGETPGEISVELPNPEWSADGGVAAKVAKILGKADGAAKPVRLTDGAKFTFSRKK